MDKERIEEFRKLYASWSDEALIRALKHEHDDYRPEALGLMEAELKKRDITFEESRAVETRVKQRIEKEKKRLGGWLLVFIIWLGSSVFTTLSALDYVFEVSSVLGVIGFAQLLFAIVVFGMMFTRLRVAVTLVKVMIGIELVMQIPLLIVSIVKFQLSPLILALMILITARSAILIAWFFYFKKSKRVAMAYGLDMKNTAVR